MPTENIIDEEEKLESDNLVTMFVDGMYLYTRKDKLTFLRFTSSLPNGIRNEVARIMITEKHLTGMIDTMCTAINHYPKKPDSTRKRSTRNKVVKKS